MDYSPLIASASIAVALASSAYGIWQARRAAKAEKARDNCLAAALETQSRLNGRLQSTERALKRVNERFDQAEADLLAERKAHAITKGLLTKAKNKNSAQAEAAAKQGG